MHVCIENEVVRQENEYQICAWHVKKHEKRGGPPLKRRWLTYTCVGTRWSYAHSTGPKWNGFAYERDQKTSSEITACRTNNKSVSRSYEKPKDLDIGHLRLTDRERSTHTYTDTGTHWQSIELRLSEYNEKELKDLKIGVIGLFFDLLRKANVARLFKA